jgi:L-lactate dehydrogenase complex protein LldG
MPSARENILGRIEQALSNPASIPFNSEETASAFFEKDRLDLRSKFIDSYSKLEGYVFTCNTIQELHTRIQQLAFEKNWSPLYCQTPELINRLQLWRLALLSADPNIDYNAAITDCECLVARTGTVVLSSAQASGRMLPVYAPVHIVISTSDKIVYDIDDALHELKKKYESALPSGIFFASGPSRTADIEKTLVLGVHGPKEVYLFLADIDNEI